MSYVNVHGDPVAVDLQALVLELHPGARVQRRLGRTNGDEAFPETPYFSVLDRGANILGGGATEEEAWRRAYMRVTGREDEKK